MSLHKRTVPELGRSGSGASLEWNDLSVLLAVCRAGSLSGAARLLGQNHSTVFRRINAIEERTGVRFFERLPQGYAMTDAGRTALAYAERIETEVHSFGREILGQDMRLEGRVGITAPEGLSATLLPPLIAEFRRSHPGVHVDVVGSASAFDLSRREADLAIRATRKPPEQSIGRRVSDFRFALYAAPGYLEQREGVAPNDLDWCVLEGFDGWLVPAIFKTPRQVQQRKVFSASSTFAVMQAAAEGMGVTLLPCYLGDPDARLLRASEPLEALTIQLWLLTHADLRHTARVKALLGFLHERISRQSAIFEGRHRTARVRTLIRFAG